MVYCNTTSLLSYNEKLISPSLKTGFALNRVSVPLFSNVALRQLARPQRHLDHRGECLQSPAAEGLKGVFVLPPNKLTSSMFVKEI